jgi:hypothetical protein
MQSRKKSEGLAAGKVRNRTLQATQECGTRLVCVVAFFAEIESCAYAYGTAHSVIHNSVVGESALSEGIYVSNFSVHVNRPRPIPQVIDLRWRQRWIEFEHLISNHSRPQYRCWWGANNGKSSWKSSGQWVFSKTNISPVQHLECGSLTCIFNHNECSRTSGSIGYSCVSQWKDLSRVKRDRISDINNHARVAKYIRSQLPLRSSPRNNRLVDENSKTNPSPNDTDDGCPHIMPSETVERGRRGRSSLGCRYVWLKEREKRCYPNHRHYLGH